MASRAHGSVAGAESQPPEVGGAPAVGWVELRALGPVEAVIGGKPVDLGPPSSVLSSRC
jgi:hypothetical protein